MVNGKDTVQEGELSDWAIAVVIVFDRTLNATEITLVEIWLAQLYGLTISSAPAPPPPPSPYPPEGLYNAALGQPTFAGRAISRSLYRTLPGPNASQLIFYDNSPGTPPRMPSVAVDGTWCVTVDMISSTNDCNFNMYILDRCALRN